MTDPVEPIVAKPEDRKEAVKTFIDQTKLLVTLASAFIVAPAAAVTLLKGQGKTAVEANLQDFAWAEGFLVTSVIMGYLVLASISGFQHIGIYDVYRKATRVFSLLQMAFYVLGLVVFVRYIYYSF